MANRANYIRGHELSAVARGFHDKNLWAIMADCFDDHAHDVDNGTESAKLCRLYPQLENYRRCGMPIPQEVVEEYTALNALYELPDEVPLDGGQGQRGTHYMRVGPFYTALRCGLGLTSNWKWMDDEPIRHLELSGLQVNDDLGLILRNHRLEWVSTIRLRFFRGRVNASEVANVVKQMTTNWLNCFEFFIEGVDDRLKLIRTAFNMLRSQPRRGFLPGAKLYINGRPD